MATRRRTRNKSRFSLLLLEDGEVLLSDIAAQYHFIPGSPSASSQHPLSSYPERFLLRSTNSSVRGRFKIGTRNIFFDSEDWRDPVVRIPLASVDRARPTRDGSHSKSSDDPSTTSPLQEEVDDYNSVLIMAKSMIFMREMGTDHPFIDMKVSGKHIFTPLYTTAVELLDEVNSLIRITSKSSRRERDQRLRELVQERESRVPFDITLLEHGEQETALMDSSASAVYAMSRAPGRVRITKDNLYFMSIHSESSHYVERITTHSISSIRRLRHGCRDAALEVGYRLSEGHSHQRVFSTLMVSFPSRQCRERAIQILLGIVKQKVEMFDRAHLEKAVTKWREGEMSNFEYLMYLNLASGRSFNDLSQYPVFPWVLKDYSSNALDLSSESVFRDLTLPVGALNPERLSFYKQRFEEMGSPRFFYGTHYSAPAYTINYLVRAAPAAMLRLQNGKFDMPDRLFHNMESTWKGVLSNHGDVKELIPEFFVLDYSGGNCSGIVPIKSTPGEFLDNVLGLDLGTRQDGKKVGDVELPPWANGSSELFVRRNREALESDYVSSRLHEWIDLVFGVKSQSAEACNVFYTDVALPSVMDTESTSKLTDEEINQIETVYLEFGRTPQRLFGHPHPPRFGDYRDLHSNENIAEPIVKEQGGSLGASTTRQRPCNDRAPDSVPSSNLDDSSDSSSGSLNYSETKTILPLSWKAKGMWGSHTRRRDSVLQGTTDHVLASYEPTSVNGDKDQVHEVSKPLIAHLDLTDGTAANLEIVDMSLRDDSTQKDPNGTYSSNEEDTPAICTVWSDGYLKVHSESKMLRSKYIGDSSSVVYVQPDLVVYGTPTGSIGVYNISTGRNEIAQVAAHDAEVCTLEYVPECHALISGSKDASIKVWRFERPSTIAFSLRLAQELDAECCIQDMSAMAEKVRTADESTSQNIRLLIAAATLDGELLAWEIDLAQSENDFLEPIWRSEKGKGSNESVISSRRTRKLTWLYQGAKRRPALVSLHEQEKCLRVWKLNQEDMASAEVFLQDGGAHCVISRPDARTVLVGGTNGRISEFDSTGLCLGEIVSGSNEVRNVLLPRVGGRMYVFAGRSEAIRIDQ